MPGCPLSQKPFSQAGALHLEKPGVVWERFEGEGDIPASVHMLAHNGSQGIATWPCTNLYVSCAGSQAHGVGKLPEERGAVREPGMSSLAHRVLLRLLFSSEEELLQQPCRVMGPSGLWGEHQPRVRVHLFGKRAGSVVLLCPFCAFLGATDVHGS